MTLPETHPLLRRLRRRREGMTLVEIMIVVVIMAMIAGAVGIAVLPKWREAQIKSARTDAQTIRAAAESYMLMNSTADCPSVATLLEAGEINRQTRSKDPWDNDFRIECQGTDVLVTSGGPDGQFGGDDDIH